MARHNEDPTISPEIKALLDFDPAAFDPEKEAKKKPPEEPILSPYEAGELTLYKFQKDGIDRMNEMPHVLLFDGTGFGKTAQIIRHIEDKNLFPCLVLCLKTLKINWIREIDKWGSHPAFYAFDVDDLVDNYVDQLQKDPLSTRKYWLLHHDSLAFVDRDQTGKRDVIFTIPWKSIIVDESHKFRNPDTLRTDSLTRFNGPNGKRPSWNFLTATPIVNGTMDLYPMLQLIGTNISRIEYADHFTQGRDSYGNPRGTRNLDQLKKLLAHVIIWRDESEAEGLPAQTLIPVILDMPDDQRAIYDQCLDALVILLDDFSQISTASTLAMITRLRQLSLDPTIVGRSSSSSKLKAIPEIMDQAPNEKWVIYSTSKQFMRRVEKTVFKPGECVFVSGDDQRDWERQDKIDRFWNDPECKAFLGTEQLGMGINLQCSHNIIICDRWWNDALVEQAIGRVRRIGQKASHVNVFILENKDSIDDTLRQICADKRALSTEFASVKQLAASLYEQRTGSHYDWPEKMKNETEEEILTERLDTIHAADEQLGKMRDSALDRLSGVYKDRKAAPVRPDTDNDDESSEDDE